MNAGRLFAADALLPGGWARGVLLEWDEGGCLTSVQTGVEPPSGGVPTAAGPVLPGMPNLHSHAFQRAFAGLTERRAAASLQHVATDEAAACEATVADDFWGWRSMMYRFAARLTPGQLEAIAFGLYVEMLEGGYTSVCEFHYVHHDLDGRPYADDATLALALLAAARRAGIGITLLPVLYQSRGFGGQAPTQQQRRFVRSTGSMLRLLERLRPVCAARDSDGIPSARLGLAPHSLRAVGPDALRDALAGLDAIDPSAPIHIHVAEQTQEVAACVAWSGQRPVAWLLDHAPVDARWCLVHATHMDADEGRHAAASGAVAGLCPSTEANLGDGVFDLPAWLAARGRWGIGSDSHVAVDAAAELMLLEYGQRLVTRTRNVAATAAQPHTATAITLAAVAGGAQASGRSIAGLAVGEQADCVVLDANHPALDGLAAPDMLSSHVFAGTRRNAAAALHAVWVAGRRRVANGVHDEHSAAGRGLLGARKKLLAP